MPRALDPQARFPIVLDSDKGKTPEPTFWFKYLTGREHMQVDETTRQIDGMATDVELYGPVYSALRIGLVGWDNLVGPDGPIPYTPANLECILDYREACELVGKMRQACILGAEDAKKSESQSGSDAANSPASADQPQTSQPKSSAPAAEVKAAKNAKAATTS